MGGTIMKSIAILLLVFIIPVMLLGSFLTLFSKLNLPNQQQARFLDRTWRLNETLEELFTFNQWHINARYNYYYDSEHPACLDSLVMYSFGTMVPNEWSPLYSLVYHYNPAYDRVIGIDMFLYMGMGPYFVRKITYTYDDSGYLTQQLMEFNTSPVTPNWMLESWTKITYNSVIDYAVYNYTAANSTDPQEWSKLNFTWDNQGRIHMETEMVSPDSVNWINHERITRSYNLNDTTTGAIFVNNIAIWLPYQIMGEQLSFNGCGSMFGMVGQEVLRVWETSDWYNSEEDLYNYNSNNKLTEHLHKTWNEANSYWNNYERFTYTYDANNNIQDYTFQNWNTTNQVYDNFMRHTCTWTSGSANEDNSVPVVNELHIIAAPNPFNKEVSLRINAKTSQPAVLQVFNLKGQLIKTISANTNSDVKWDGTDQKGLPASAGIYFVKALCQSQSTTIKTVKVK